MSPDHNPRKAVPKMYVSGKERLEFFGERPTKMTPYSYRLEGTSYGKEWAVNLSHEGLRTLIKILVGVL